MRRWFGADKTGGVQEIRDAMRKHHESIERFDASRRQRAVELIQFYELPIDPTAATDEQLERAVLMELQAMILRDQVRNRVKQEELK